MARTFVAASSQHLSVDSASVQGVAAEPFSMGLWYNVPDVANNYNIMSVGDKDASNSNRRVMLRGSTGGDKVQGGIHESSFFDVSTSTVYTINTWEHALFVEETTTSRHVYRNGGSKGTVTTLKDHTSSNWDRMSIGKPADSTPDGYFDGRLAEAAIWNVALSDDDAAALGAGMSPLLVRPDALVNYWPLYGNASPEPDIVGGADMTVTGATKSTDHPRIYYPRRRTISFPVASGGGGGGRIMGSLAGYGGLAGVGGLAGRGGGLAG